MRRLVVLTLLLSLVAPACGEEEPLTIMPIGDSITSGSTGWATYRCFLHEMLQGAGVSFDLVGAYKDSTMGESGCPHSFDTDHHSVWAISIDEIHTSAVETAEALQPDIALIYLGGNDLFRGDGPVAAANQLESLITDLQAVSPDLTLFVAQLIPCRGGRNCRQAIEFNDLIASYSSLSTNKSSVIVVDMETDSGQIRFRDNWHPSDTGNEILASRWMAALQEAGLVPTES